MKYDDASWHYEGDFPSDLPTSAGATHIGMFLARAVSNGFAGPILTEDSPETLKRLRQRQITPAQLLILACDGKFTDEDLSDEGNEFARYYFNSDGKWGAYLTAYETALGQREPTLYHIADTWTNYDCLAPIIQKRFDEWRGSL